jgi:hypothetical protein
MRDRSPFGCLPNRAAPPIPDIGPEKIAKNLTQPSFAHCFPGLLYEFDEYSGDLFGFRNYLALPVNLRWAQCARLAQFAKLPFNRDVDRQQLLSSALVAHKVKIGCARLVALLLGQQIYGLTVTVPLHCVTPDSRAIFDLRSDLLDKLIKAAIKCRVHGVSQQSSSSRQARVGAKIVEEPPCSAAASASASARSHDNNFPVSSSVPAYANRAVFVPRLSALLPTHRRIATYEPESQSIFNLCHLF